MLEQDANDVLIIKWCPLWWGVGPDATQYSQTFINTNGMG